MRNILSSIMCAAAAITALCKAEEAPGVPYAGLAAADAPHSKHPAAGNESLFRA